MSGFLDLPIELGSGIVGQWLYLKDVVRLDSAFCHHVMRNVLHESIFQSPCCVIAIAHPRIYMVTANCSWVLMKGIRLSYLHVESGASFETCVEYLKRFGDTVNSVALICGYGDSFPHLTLVARYCPNLCVLDTSYCDLSPCVEFLKSCALLRSVAITSDRQTRHLMHSNIPATHHLQIASITLHCSQGDEEVILGMCDPLCVQRLRLANMTNINWQTFVNLRSFGFCYNSHIHDANLLATICTLCPWIVNLEVYSSGWLSDEIVVPAIAALKQLRTFHCEYLDNLTDNVVNTLIEHHKHTLEAVYLYDCDSISGSAINRMLTECVKLHTLSCGAQDNIDYSLMGNLTTLIMKFPSVNVWNGVQQHCHSLQCLHLVPLFDNDNAFSHINVDADANNLQALHTVYTARAYVNDLRLQLPSVCVVEEAIGNWYDLFELPI